MDIDDEPMHIEEDEEEIAVTRQEVVAGLQLHWMNERCAPVLLPHRMEFVDSLADIMSQDEKGLRKNDRSEITGSKRLEIARIQYLINSYLRARLQKIEMNPADVLSRHTYSVRELKVDLLDSREVQFAEDLMKANKKCFDDAFLSHLPPGLQAQACPKDRSEMKRCFIKVGDQDVANVSLPDMSNPNGVNMITLAKGSTHFLPFCSIASVLQEEKVRLV